MTMRAANRAAIGNLTVLYLNENYILVLFSIKYFIYTLRKNFFLLWPLVIAGVFLVKINFDNLEVLPINVFIRGFI